MKIFSLSFPENTRDDLVELNFKFSIESMPQSDTEDNDFPYEDEIFLVNFGEVGKFPSNYIYQTKFLVLRDGDGLNFNGYAPDFARKSNIIRDINGNTRFELGRTYSVSLKMTKYRVYINVDNGFAVTSYGNGRDEVSDVAFYARDGVEVKLSDCAIKSGRIPKLPIDENLSFFVDKGLVCNYLTYHVGLNGVYFDRLSVEQNIKCTTRNSGAYQSNVCIDVYTDARTLGIEYELADQPCEKWSTQFGFLLNGKRVERDIRITEKDKTYTEVFNIPATAPEYNRITIFFPFSVSAAVKKVFYTPGAKFAKPYKRGWINFYGDSITEGSECFDASAVYVSQVCMAYNYNGLDQAVSGRTFNDYNVLGDYFINPDYVFIANGTNSFCMGTGVKNDVFRQMEENMKIVIDSAKMRFPNAKIIGLLPIWRSDERGENFSLEETSAKIREVYESYGDIAIIDCHSFVPQDVDYFSSVDLAIHPNSKGHDEYAKHLLKALEGVMGSPAPRDDAELAKEALSTK